MLFQQIDKNKRKTFFIVLFFALFVLALGGAAAYISFGDPISGVILALVFSLIYIPAVLLSSTGVVMRMNRAKEIKSAEDARFLWRTVENLAMVAKVPMPRVFIIEETSPNAFATGLSPKKAAVAVTTGLLESLDREEIEAVVAHEMAHIRNYDVRLSTIALALVSVVALLADLGSRFVFSRRNKDAHPAVLVIGLIFLILSPFIAAAIQLALSRNREYLADASGAELCRNPLALSSALRKIALSGDSVDGVSKASASLYFSDPFKKKAASLFSTHPPAEERIRRLENM